MTAEGRTSDARPRVVLSRCLEFAACRYDGGGIESPVVRLLAGYVEYVPVCPEVRIGLGVPRPPIRIEETDGVQRLVQPSTGRDLTEPMTSFSHGFADGTGDVDGLILKSRSPSCGIGDVKIHVGGEPGPEPGDGMFARVMADRYPGAALEDEARLVDGSTRHRWLTRVWASARLREAVSTGPAGLASHHDRYAPLLARAPAALRRRLDALVDGAVSEGGPGALDVVVGEYRSLFATTAEPVGGPMEWVPLADELEPYPAELRP